MRPSYLINDHHALYVQLNVHKTYDTNVQQVIVTPHSPAEHGTLSALQHYNKTATVQNTVPALGLNFLVNEMQHIMDFSYHGPFVSFMSYTFRV